MMGDIEKKERIKVLQLEERIFDAIPEGEYLSLIILALVRVLKYFVEASVKEDQK